MKKSRKTKKKNFFRFLIILLLIPLISWYFWIAQKTKETNIYILNKTVPSIERAEHKSFFWVLNHFNYYNDKGTHYSIDKDYYGFFPKDIAKHKFDFKSIRINEIQEISKKYDMLYYIDTYGVHSYSGYSEKYKVESKRLYGGLNNNDYLLLKGMKEKKKLIIAEYNLLALPTNELVRNKTEDLFNINWSGWIGCYFSSLNNRGSSELLWFIKAYEEQNNVSWNFKNSGIILIYKSGKIVVLENGTHLNFDAPVVKTSEYGQKNYGLPATINYPYWFDIIYSGEKNQIVSEYHLHVNETGDSVLNEHLIPSVFPAIVEHKGDYKFYYFSGDFANTDIPMTSSYFKGIKYLDFMFYSNYKKNRNEFFWKFYLPLISSILEDEYLGESE